jgi:hypothetical protein
MKKIFVTGLVAFAAFVIPAFARAATLYINPGSGSFAVGSTFSVSVRVNTEGAAVNTAEATVDYSTDTLDLVSVSAGSTFTLQTPGSPSRSGGRAYFSGGIPTPGYRGSGGIVGVMTFRAKAVGQASLSIQSGKVLLNDGQGTSALSGSSGASYTITPPAVEGPEVVSSTHPDPNAWYSLKDSVVSWNRPSGAYGFSFELDQKEDTVPDNTLDTTITTSASYKDLPEGVSYFHIKAREQAGRYGSITHFKIQTDYERPLLFDISLVGQNNLNDVTRTPTLTFEAQDELSGIGFYNVYLDGELVKEKAASPYTFDKLETGPHIIRVVAYDKAGNDRKAELPIIVTGPDSAAIGAAASSPIPLPWLIYMLIATNFLTLILVIIALFYRRKKEAELQDPVAAVQGQIDASLEELKLHINKQLTKFAKQSASRLYSKENEVATEVFNSIGQTKEKIDKQVNSLRKAKKK